MPFSNWLRAPVPTPRSQFEDTGTSKAEEASYEGAAAQDIGSQGSFGWVDSVKSVGEITDTRLGKMSLQLPHYVKLDYNEATRKASFKVEDRKERKQREMWGEI